MAEAQTTHPGSLASASLRTPALAVTNPSGNRNRMALDVFPFLIGRQGDNQLVLRDNRISRTHARIVAEGGEYFVEDMDSRHGVYVNGQRTKRGKLREGDRIDFGFQDSYRMVFTLQEDELNKFLGQISAAAATGASNLSKLRSLVEVARALQSSLSTNDVLAAVVDAALSVTGAERGFLLLGKDDSLEVSVARDRRGAPLDISDLTVPRSLINRALRSRRDLLSMTFDPTGADGVRPDMSVAGLELRSVVCVPLIQVRTGSLQETVATSLNETVGVLYMDSRGSAADLSSGNREILQTLALEASTILENARLLDEERSKQHMEDELNVARTIQTGLLPRELPTEGWFRAMGSSIASRQVGGDYFDVRQINPDLFACVITDVSGKGVSAALLAALLQGAFVFASEASVRIDDLMSRVNRFLYERARGEKYATVVYCTVSRSGELRWSNAGHPKPLLVRVNNEPRALESTGIPIGMMDIAMYDVKSIQLEPGDKIVLFSDGVSEAANAQGECFEKQRMNEVLRTYASASCAELHAKLVEAVEEFSDTDEEDDITMLVLEYQPNQKT
ncbi:MAG TPA: SpoIIE family protein phosphatase [Bryobacteraceae bacterium]|nr:SpoIIE family protein phosphatase [Bryobacteraceae bacterium]